MRKFFQKLKYGEKIFKYDFCHAWRFIFVLILMIIFILIKNKMKRFYYCLSLLFSATGVLFSQEKEDSTRLSKVKEIQEVTVTSTGLKTSLKNFGGTVNVVSATQIRELSIPSVGDALRLVPGANYIDEDGRGLKPGVGIRGLDPSRNRTTLVLIDGKIPIGQSYLDMGGYYMVPVRSVENIEVMKGASPVLYGSGSIGGIVNIITKKGSGVPYTKINLQAGNSKSFNLDLENSGKVEEMTYYIGFHRRQGDGFRKSRGHFSTNDFMAQAVGKFGDKNEVKFFVDGFTEYSQTPGGLTQRQWEESSHQSVNPHDFFEAKRFSTTLSYKRNIDELNSLTTAVYASYLNRDWWLDNRNKDQSKRKFQGALRHIPTLGLFSDYERKNNLFGQENKLLAGIRLHKDITYETSVVSDHFGQKGGKEKGSSNTDVLVAEAYLYDEFHLTEDLRINPGIRYTYANTKQYELTKTGEINSKSQKVLTYSLGMFYQFDKDNNTYFTYSKGYQIPRAKDIFNLIATEDLKAETSNNYEFGLRTSPFEWLKLDASLYIMDFGNQLVNEGGLLINGGKTFHKGIELEASAFVTNGLKLYGTATFQRATFKNGINKGKELPYAPKFLSTIGLRHQFELYRGILVSNIYTNYVGAQFSDAVNTVEGTADGLKGMIPKYWLLNATVNYNIGDWNFNLSGLNLLNRKYFTTRHSSWGGIMPAATISVMGGIGYKF